MPINVCSSVRCEPVVGLELRQRALRRGPRRRSRPSRRHRRRSPVCPPLGQGEGGTPEAAESASTKLGMLSGLVLALAATTRNVPAPPSLVTSSVQPIAEGSLITLTPPTGSVTTVGDSPAPQGFSPPLGGPTLSPPPQAQRARTAATEDVRRKFIEWARKDAGSVLVSSPDSSGSSTITDPCFGSAAMAPAKFSA